MADPQPHFYQDVPGWFDWPDVYASLVEVLPDGAHVVEVGAWQGQSAAFMGVEIANSGKAIRFDAVDTWQGSDEPQHQNDPDVQHGRLYDVFLANTAPVRQYVRPIRSTSVDAAEQYGDASLDVVFLDGDHTTEAVLADLQAWWPKVKPGGWLLGHDRDWATVARAVRAFESFCGVRVRPVSSRCFEFRKPIPVTDWAVPEAERAVLVAICSNERSIYRQTAKSLLDVVASLPDACKAHGYQDFQHLWVDQYPSVAAMRDYTLMAATVMGASHVLFLDADMTWPKEMAGTMLAHHSVGMVSGVYHLKQWPYWPILLDRPFIDAEKLTTEYHYAPQTLDGEGLQPVSLIGMGCALVPMKVTRAFPRPWFEYVLDNVGLPAITEDVAFCARARAVGCPVWVDPSVQCGHIGQQVITAPWFRRAQCEMALLAQKRESGEDVHRFDQLFEARQDGSAA